MYVQGSCNILVKALQRSVCNYHIRIHKLFQLCEAPTHGMNYGILCRFVLWCNFSGMFKAVVPTMLTRAGL